MRRRNGLNKYFAQDKAETILHMRSYVFIHPSSPCISSEVPPTMYLYLSWLSRHSSSLTRLALRYHSYLHVRLCSNASTLLIFEQTRAHCPDRNLSGGSAVQVFSSLSSKRGSSDSSDCVAPSSKYRGLLFGSRLKTAVHLPTSRFLSRCLSLSRLPAFWLVVLCRATG